MISIEHIQNLLDMKLQRITEMVLMRTGLSAKFPKESSNIAEYILRKGKRIRPILFILSYKGFSPETPAKLFSSAAALELMHTFALIQDDVIDNSDLRRGSQSLHCVLKEFCKKDNKKGKDLAIVISDLLYSYAMKIFSDIDEDFRRKDSALQYILNSAIITSIGQFSELVFSNQRLSSLSFSDIISTYDNKTAAYTFSGPLVAGAILAGAETAIISNLKVISILLGRAYQLFNDISDFSDPASNLIAPDFSNNRKTMLLWYLYKVGDKSTRALIEELDKGTIDSKTFSLIRFKLTEAGIFTIVKNDIRSLIEKAFKTFDSSIQNCETKNYIKDFVVGLFQPLSQAISMAENNKTRV
jgi:geranylgeranyl diphosphate synthase, type I